MVRILSLLLAVFLLTMQSDPRLMRESEENISEETLVAVHYVSETRIPAKVEVVAQEQPRPRTVARARLVQIEQEVFFDRLYLRHKRLLI